MVKEPGGVPTDQLRGAAKDAAHGSLLPRPELSNPNIDKAA
jgi:hypothetical protein